VIRTTSKACVILPTYDEAENVRVLIPAIFAQADQLRSHELHVVVVDDDSPDGTAAVVRELQGRYRGLHLVTGRKSGLGEAYKRGMSWAMEHLEPDLVLQMDADLQHPPALIPLFVALAGYGFTLVIGSRFAPGGSTPEFSLWRRLMSLFGNWLIRFLGGLPRLHDCTSGFRCIRAELLRRCDFSFLSTRGYSFQSSLLFELLRNGARPIEVPMEFGRRAQGESKLSLRDQVEFLANVLKIRFRRSEEFFRYCVVGGLGVLVNMGVLVAVRRAGVRLEVASPVAIELSIVFNYVLNAAWTFRRRAVVQGPVAGRFVRFHLVAAAAGLVNYAALLVLARIFGVWYVAANLAGIAIATLVNYSLNSLWTWRRAHAHAGPRDIGLSLTAPGPRAAGIVKHGA
jgi:dolichol-phosphate mannosyltransferase